MTKPEGANVPRSKRVARRGGGAGANRNVTLQNKSVLKLLRAVRPRVPPQRRSTVGPRSIAQQRSMGRSRVVTASVPDTPVVMRILGVPAARTLVNEPNGVACDSGRITLVAGDATACGHVFAILASPRNCDPMESLRAQEFYQGRLVGALRATYEAAQNVTIPGTVTLRWILMPGADYTKPAPATAVAMVAHENLARSCAGAARARLTDDFSVQLRLGPEYHFDVENDKEEAGVPHCSESFRPDGQVVLLEVTVANVPGTAIPQAADLPLGTINWL